MKTPTIKLDDPLYQADYWVSDDDKHFIAGYKPEGLPTVTIKVPRDELERYHADLPLSFAIALAWRRENRGVNHFNKSVALDNLRLLKQGGPTFVDLGTTACLLTAMSYMRVEADTSKPVEFQGDVTNVESMRVTGRTIYFAGDFARRRIFVDREELTQRHPEWESRYTVATELGFTGDALMHHVFYPEIKPIAVIDGISFG